MTENLKLKRLSRSSIDYIAHTVIGDNCATIEFSGEFAGEPVIWNAKVVALNVMTDAPNTQYIEINDDHRAEGSIPVEIGLFVNAVDEPTVTKVIKMMRQYKNLHSGRHEFSGTNK